MTWVAIGAGGASSPDGINWTQRYAPFGTLVYNGATWANDLGLFIIVGGSDTTRTIATSATGATWTGRMNQSGGRLQGVAWSPDEEVAVAVGNGGQVFTSPNAVNWTSRTSGTSGDLNDVAWSSAEDLFVAVGAAGDIRTSPDGVTWTASTSGTSEPLRAVAWSPDLGLFVAGGGHPFGTLRVILSSPDGITWTVRANVAGTLSAPSGQVTGVAWSPSLGLFAAATTAGTVFTSPNGTTWTERAPGIGAGLQSIAWSPNLLQFSVGRSGGRLATSSNGINWTERDVPLTEPINALAWAGSNQPPNAPALVFPTTGGDVNRAVAQQFAWLSSDPDPGDSQSSFELRARVQTTTPWTVEVAQDTPNNFYTFPPDTFTAGDWEWQVRTADQVGEWGPWSAVETFTAVDPPPGPTITSPANASTVATSTAPVVWSVAGQDAYEVRIVGDDNGSPSSFVRFNSGQIAAPSVRSIALEFPTNNVTEHIQVRVRLNDIWSVWASVRVDVDYEPPAEPVVTLVTDDVNGSIVVQPTFSAPSGPEPTVVVWDVRVRVVDGRPDLERPVGGVGIRIARDLPATQQAFVDRAVASGVAYAYQVIAYGDNDTFAASPWVTDHTSDPGFYGGGYP